MLSFTSGVLWGAAAALGVLPDLAVSSLSNCWQRSAGGGGTVNGAESTCVGGGSIGLRCGGVELAGFDLLVADCNSFSEEGMQLDGARKFVEVFAALLTVVSWILVA